MTRQINAGGLLIGGGAPVSVQSMTNTPTADIKATSAQISALAEAGCELVRVAVPDLEAASALRELKKLSPIPIAADIHFDYRLALEASEAGVDKIRINPGNIGGSDRVAAVAKACRDRGIPIRIGVNGGSLEKELLARYSGITAEAMVESALGHIALLEKEGFHDICVSLKASDVPLTVAAYRLMASRCEYPLHLGVTETGTQAVGSIKSAIGIGSLLLDGIGDTIRVSLTADPVREIETGLSILRACGIRKTGVNIISCPTCGRCKIDLIPLANEVEQRLKGRSGPLTVAVMGCMVNGPGEASHADAGIAGGVNEGIVFKNGRKLKVVPRDELVNELLKAIDEE